MAPQILGLKQAIPYLKKYRGKLFVIKIGGSLLDRKDEVRQALEGVAALHHMGIRVVLVHGGGSELDALASQMNVTQKKVAGRRVTSAETLDLAKMVYAGKLNTDVVSYLTSLEVSCFGMTGLSAGTILATRRPPVQVTDAASGASEEVDYGYVGDIVKVDPAPILHLISAGHVPVFASLAADAKGNVFNVNADTVAEKIAVALGAEKLIIVTDTAGILKDLKDVHTLVSYADIQMVESMKNDGLLKGGMLPKAQACVSAVRGGVKRAHIINGLESESLLKEIFTNEGCGTLIVEKIETNGNSNG